MKVKLRFSAPSAGIAEIEQFKVLSSSQWKRKLLRVLYANCIDESINLSTYSTLYKDNKLSLEVRGSSFWIL